MVREDVHGRLWRWGQDVRLSRCSGVVMAVREAWGSGGGLDKAAEPWPSADGGEEPVTWASKDRKRDIDEVSG